MRKWTKNGGGKKREKTGSGWLGRGERDRDSGPVHRCAERDEEEGGIEGVVEEELKVKAIQGRGRMRRWKRVFLKSKAMK